MSTDYVECTIKEAIIFNISWSLAKAFNLMSQNLVLHSFGMILIYLRYKEGAL